MAEYFRWPIGSDVPLYLEIAKIGGAGLTGSSPTVAIRRLKSVNGSFLDGYYWDGVGFSASVTFLTMEEYDETNYPGLYTYCFSQSLIQTETIYNIYYKHDSNPIGFNQETHWFTLTGSSGDMKVWESEPV